MIRTETIKINNKNFIHTWSDEGFYIYGGSPVTYYGDAYDPSGSNRTYIETSIPVETPIPDDEETESSEGE